MQNEVLLLYVVNNMFVLLSQVIRPSFKQNLLYILVMLYHMFKNGIVNYCSVVLGGFQDTKI